LATPVDIVSFCEDNAFPDEKPSIAALFTWSKDSDLDFNLKKFVYLSFKHKLAIYLDICKAFDTVSHSFLLTKLWSTGITGTIWSGFKTYLSHRYQRVSINNCYSDFRPVVSGVPQGSILGPLVYINDMTSCIHHMSIAKVC